MDRRKFLKVSSWAGGGMMISFDWFAGQIIAQGSSASLPQTWSELNSYIRIANDGAVTLLSPNPEFGSNVITSMPMILAEELDVDWKSVTVEQADFLPQRFDRQFTGGSQAIRQGWKGLRLAGATARRLLLEAAAKTWQVSVSEITTQAGSLMHKPSGRKARYGEMASLAATLPVPKDVKVKDVRDFKIIGTSRKNVEGRKIVTGKPLFTIDHKQEGMLLAMVEHPPAFGMRVKSVDDRAARAMPGIQDVFIIKTLEDGYERNAFDTTSFTELVAIVGKTTWEVMNAKKALKIEWEPDVEKQVVVSGWTGKQTVKIPAGLESTADHQAKMTERAKQPGKIERRDGDPETAFRQAARVIERTYTAPFLAHNTMEPVSCYAHVTADQAEIYGPIQAPEFIVRTLAARLALPKEKVKIRLARMGGGFGLRAYGHHMVEAAVISQKLNAPVKLVYTREDDMTYGIYRPTYTATYRAALDAENRLLALHVKAGGIPESPLHANRFPAGAIDNYLAESWEIDSNITIGAFRAPRSNFIASAEQCFLDELAEAMGKDPIDFRIELLDRARRQPVGKNNDYDAERYAGVLKLVREKSNWNASQGKKTNVFRGVSAYFCHNTYVAEVIDLVVKNKKPVVQKVTAAVDCGIVVNRDAAINMAQGGIVDGIGNALYGELTFRNGKPSKSNFNTYRMIRHSEAPKAVDVHFVDNQMDPTGLGEPLFPPVFAAMANAMYKATSRRFYTQPFLKQWDQNMG
ncbi:MAG: molybdopterin cofactor-binding domain-containing protein [Chitinophagaceae bacterium]|jgi:isoquinoline 1-oxidoreductase beta subunit